jgi:hypothetical protein
MINYGHELVMTMVIKKYRMLLTFHIYDNNNNDEDDDDGDNDY